jgi:multicomponent Na+:H+ antiporter subunit B
MNSTILQIAQRYVRFLLLVFAVIALARGHNHPGGGFIAGLLAGLSIVMKAFAYDIEVVAKQMKFTPESIMALGIFLILASTLPSLIDGMSFMTGYWLQLKIPLLGDLKLGTPLLFDIGVFFGVIGITRLFFFSLKRAE